MSESSSSQTRREPSRPKPRLDDANLDGRGQIAGRSLPHRMILALRLFCGFRFLDRHWADFFFHFHGVDHGDGVPGAAVEEAAVGAFAQALLAADAEDGIDGDAAERRMVVVGHPEHAVFYRAIFHTGGRTRASGAALCDYREFFGLLFTRRGEAFGPRFKLLLVRNHPDGLGRSGCRRHARDYNLSAGSYEAVFSGRTTSPKMILPADFTIRTRSPPVSFCYSEPQQRSTAMAGKSLNRVQLIGNLGKDP